MQALKIYILLLLLLFRSQHALRYNNVLVIEGKGCVKRKIKTKPGLWFLFIPVAVVNA